MNKQPIDDLFEQARASLKANMPLENVEQLLQSSAGSPSKWTWKKIISSMSIIGIIITIITGSFLVSPSSTTSVATKTLPLYPPVITEEANLLESNFITINELDKNNKPIAQDSTPPPPVAPPVVAPLPPLAPFAPTAPPMPPSIPNPSNFLDSLGPKKTFTEYTLEIKKDNSERELKALQEELENYGIKLKIQELTYHPDQTIRRFKGKFETDSLFCSTQMQEHEFDIQGAFKSMQFTFRVADEKNLKYLKIQSEDFEETIECYDDKVLSSSAQAQKIAQEVELAMRVAEKKMHQVQREAELARRELQQAQKEAARSLANILRLQADSVKSVSREELLAKYPNMEKILEKNLLLDSTEHVEIYLGNLEAQLDFFKQLAKEDWPNLDSFLLEKPLPNYPEDWRLELENTRLDIEQDIQERLILQKELEKESIKRRMETRQLLEELEVELEVEGRTLEEEAAQLEKEAKILIKEAKRLKKEAKKKAKKEAQEPR